MTDPVVLLDRDGVINADSDAYVKSVAEWVPLEGSLEAIARLSHQGFRIGIATNQSGIGRGLFDLATLNAIHRELRDRVAGLGGQIELIAFCPHRPDEGCVCRKPRPGMLLELASRFGAEPARVTMVGDSLRDIQAARRAGMRPVLVRTGNGAGAVDAQPDALAGVPVFRDLSAVADSLLGAPAGR